MLRDIYCLHLISADSLGSDVLGLIARGLRCVGFDSSWAQMCWV